MGNLRANGENGSTVRSSNQDPVIGQISLLSVSFLRFCTVSNKSSTSSLNITVWKTKLEHSCSCSHINSSVTVLSVLAILQFADRSEDQIWQMRVSADCGEHAISTTNTQHIELCQCVLSLHVSVLYLSLNITFGDDLMGIFLCGTYSSSLIHALIILHAWAHPIRISSIWGTRLPPDREHRIRPPD